MIVFPGNSYVHLMARDVENRGYISRDLNIIIMTFSLFFFGLRIYSRFWISKTPGIDDAIISIGLMFAVTLSILEIKAVEYAAGRQMAEVAENNPGGLDKFFKILPTMQLLYLAGTGVVRLGIAAFLPRITNGLAKQKLYRTVIYVLGAMIIALTIGCVSGLLFECWPVKNLWDKGRFANTCYSPDREAILMYTHAAMGIFFDICLFVIPLWILKTSALVMKPRIIIVFSVALVAVACGLVRLLVIVKINMAVNTTFNIIYASVWTDLEIHVGIWVSCFPALQPILRMFTRRLGVKTTVSDTTPAYDRYGRSTLPGTSRSGNESDTWIMLDESPGARNKIESSGRGHNGNGKISKSDVGPGIAVSTRIVVVREDSVRRDKH